MKKLMKIPILSLCLLLVFLATFQVSSVSAVSSGYERVKDSISEVYLEYLPIVPYNPSQPTASEEFGIKFHFWQKSYSPFPLTQRFPRGFKLRVYYRDDSCGYSNYVTWKRWYPTSESQYGTTITWSLSGAYGPLSLSGTVGGPDVFGYDRNYDKYYKSYDGKTFLHVGDLSATYRSNYLWGDVDVYGGGSIGIPNDVAKCHEGHHALIWVHVELRWLEQDLFSIFDVYRHYDLVFGDDVPWNTDAWITVQQGNTNFAVDSGGGGCPILSVYNGEEYAEEGLIYIHATDDVVRSHTLTVTPQRVHNAYLLRLTEHPLTHSHIDQVKLFAELEDGTTIQLPLISATHSEDGNVLPKLLFSDDVRADTLGAELNNGTSQSIDLKFSALSPSLEVRNLVFAIEGHNRYVK